MTQQWGADDQAVGWGAEDRPAEQRARSGGRVNPVRLVTDRDYYNQVQAERKERIEGNQARAKTAERMNPLASVSKDFNEPRREAIGAIKHGVNRAQNALQTAEDAARGSNDLLKGASTYFGTALGEGYGAAKEIAGGTIGTVFSPVTGAFDAATRPIARAGEYMGVGDEQSNRTAINVLSLPLSLPNRAPAAASTAAKAAAPSRTAETVARFDQAGVRPNLAVTGGRGTAAATNAIAENVLAGPRVRSAARGQVADAGASAERIAGQYGTPRGKAIAGENVQSGVARFSGDKTAPGSFAANTEALYDPIFARIATGQQIASRSSGGVSPVRALETEATLKIVSNRVNGEIGSIVNDPRLSGLAKAIVQDRGVTTFEDLRGLRTWVREARKNPELRQGIDEAALGSLERALTADIYKNAENLAGSKVAFDLRRADQRYAKGMDRIKNALQPFASSKSGEGAYQRILQAAGSTSSADIRQLTSLKRSLSRDEWGDVSASIVSEMGKPSPGAAGVVTGDATFSVDNFVTNYNKISPDAKNVLFGSKGGGGERATSLQAELDNLVSVVDDLKRVQKAANASNSGVAAQTVGTIVMLANPKTFLPALTALGAAAGAGEVLSNPAVVRAIVGLGRAKTPAAQSAHMQRLQIMAKQSPAISAFVNALEAPGVTSEPVPILP